MRAHFYKEWHLMKSLWKRGKKRVLPSYLSLCHHQFRIQRFWILISTLIIHYFMWSFLSLAFPFITIQNMFPAFCGPVKLPFLLMTHAKKSSDPLRGVNKPQGAFLLLDAPHGILDQIRLCSFAVDWVVDSVIAILSDVKQVDILNLFWEGFCVWVGGGVGWGKSLSRWVHF